MNEGCDERLFRLPQQINEREKNLDRTGEWWKHTSTYTLGQEKGDGGGGRKPTSAEKCPNNGRYLA
jgi:hypothetical protein